MNLDYKCFDDLPLVLNAEQVAAVLGISRAGAYELMHRKDFPVLAIGKRMVTPKDSFIKWIRERINN